MGMGVKTLGWVVLAGIVKSAIVSELGEQLAPLLIGKGDGVKFLSHCRDPEGIVLNCASAEASRGEGETHESVKLD